MKKTLLVILGAAGLLCSNIAVAQNFTVDKDTAKGVIYNNGFLEIKDKVTNTSSNSITLDWKVISHTLPSTWTVNGFGICDNQTCINYISDNPPSLNKVNTAGAMSPSDNFDFKFQIEVAALPTGGPYYVTTSATDGTTTDTIVYEIINRFPTSVSNINRANKEDVIMYPNPARGELNVIYNGKASIKNISVYNLIGKAVSVYKVTSNNNASLDISSIPSGIYFIRLVDAQGRVVATRKFTHQ